jgi:hypothetical protein
VKIHAAVALPLNAFLVGGVAAYSTFAMNHAAYLAFTHLKILVSGSDVPV